MDVASRNNSYLQMLQYTVYGSIILYFGKGLFVPISFAVLISFVIYPTCSWMEKRGLGKLPAILINVGLLSIVLLAIVALLISQLASFLHEWPAVHEKLSEASQQFSQYLMDSFGLSKDQQLKWISKILNQSGSSILLFLQQAIYAVLILYYRKLWLHAIFQLFPREQKGSIVELLSLTITAYHNFIKGMALVYLIVGSLNSVGLLLLGVPHAMLFGFIASLLTFIPYIGIIIGSLLPITMAWITYDSVWYPIGIVAIFTFVQYLEANVIFPLAVSNRLNVNVLIMLIDIFLGGILWGMPGMILFVPFVGIAKLIADHNPKLKTLSMILGMESFTKSTTTQVHENQ
jgi:predicted PurR-regulated permease PerM